MARVCFHSDDSYKAANAMHFTFVTAGIALDGIKSEIRLVLTEIERRSGKGNSKDWRSTKPDERENYIEELLNTPQLVGRVFFSSFGTITSRTFWNARLETLAGAINRYSHGPHCQHEVGHEGLQGRPRFLLRKALIERGIRRISVEPASLDDPETRCADALAGYIRAVRFETAVGLPPLPDWFVELKID